MEPFLGRVEERIGAKRYAERFGPIPKQAANVPTLHTTNFVSTTGNKLLPDERKKDEKK